MNVTLLPGRISADLVAAGIQNTGLANGSLAFYCAIHVTGIKKLIRTITKAMKLNFPFVFISILLLRF
jgi:hypothetical protein